MKPLHERIKLRAEVAALSDYERQIFTGWSEEAFSIAADNATLREGNAQLLSKLDQMERELNDTIRAWNDCDLSAKKRIRELGKKLASAEQEATQRGARMQILREYIPCTVWHQDVLYERPEAKDWFDEDGVPVRAARETTND